MCCGWAKIQTLLLSCFSFSFFFQIGHDLFACIQGALWWVEKLLARAHVCAFGCNSSLRVCVGYLCVLMLEGEMGGASEEAVVRFSCVVNCACMHLCVQWCACLCPAACADENGVAVLHLKGSVINEMNKRP